MRWSRRALGAGTLLVLAVLADSGCGGTTLGPTDGDGDGGEGGTDGGSSSGGRSKGGAAGGAGPVADRCLLPADPGSCEAYMPSYFHDRTTGLCSPFIYGGCGGNDNRFATMEECIAACDGGLPNLDSCEQKGECVLAAPTCCGCDTVDATTLVAMNYKETGRFAEITQCEATSCGSCAVPTSVHFASPYAAVCRDSHCLVVHLDDTDVTRCSSDSDCFLRKGAVCCERCANENWVAISSEEALRALVCMDGAECPVCERPPPPDTVRAVCVEGRCRAVDVQVD